MGTKTLLKRVVELAAALTAAREAAEAIPVEDLKGTGNLDSPEIRLRGWTHEDVDAAASMAGIRCFMESPSRWTFGGWNDWQGSNRTIKAQAFTKAMHERGFDATTQYVLD